MFMNLWVEYKKLIYANISMRVYQLCKKMHEVYQGGWFLMKLDLFMSRNGNATGSARVALIPTPSRLFKTNLIPVPNPGRGGVCNLIPILK